MQVADDGLQHRSRRFLPSGRQLSQNPTCCCEDSRDHSLSLPIPEGPINCYAEATNPMARETFSLTPKLCVLQYIAVPYMEQTVSRVEWKKGSAELLILSLVEARP